MTAAAAAFLDANVLYSSVIRNLLMYLHLGGLYRPAWSDAVHDEWIEALLRQRTDLNRGQLQRTRDLMNEHALGASITDFEHLIPSLELPDAKDRHVVAAAITCGADFIVTMNVRDFPAHVLAPNGIRAIHPDEFVLDLFKAEPASVAEAVRLHRSSLRNPAQSVEDYLASLERAGMHKTVEQLRVIGALL